MTFHPVKFEDTHVFDPLFLSFVNKSEKIDSFHCGLLDFEKEFVFRNDFSSPKRLLLQQVLKEQYDGFTIHESVENNLNMLSQENTFTVTCGHQLNLFTGPYFFMFKILSTIKSCQVLKSKHPDKSFVPVFWMATEDHDFEEINHFQVFGKRFDWNVNSNQMVTGKINTQEMQEFLDALPADLQEWTKFYRSQPNLEKATRALVNQLFGKFGLLILDGNHHDLKSAFSHVMKDDLLTQEHHILIERTSENLDSLGYKKQLHTRPVNLFYIQPKSGQRIRLIAENDCFKLVDETKFWNRQEVLDEIDSYPERFSPNAALRPIYQEMVLPNVAFVGGPAEISYWLQLKACFVKHNVPFPLLKPRFFGALIPEKSLSKWNSFGLDCQDIFLEEHALSKKLAKKDFMIDLGEEKMTVSHLKESLSAKLSQIDPTLKPFALAELTKVEKIIEDIEKKAVKTAERKEVDKFDQALKIAQKVVSNNTFVERKENILSFLVNNPTLLDQLFQNMPSDDQFYLVGI